MSIEVLLGIGVAINRLVELLKPGIKQIPLSDELKHWLTLAISLVIGVLLAFAFKLNPLAGYENFADTPVWIGTLLIGLVLGAGSNFTNGFISFIEAIGGNRKSDSSATVTVETTGGGKASANMVPALAPPALDPNAVG